MATLLSGIVGGLLGSIVTGAAMVAVVDDAPPSAVVWAKYLGDGIPGHYRMTGFVVHLVYGALAGTAFVALAGALSLGTATLAGALLWAVVWSAVLLGFAVGFWSIVVLGDRPDPGALVPMVAVHLAFGVVLGLVVAVVPSL